MSPLLRVAGVLLLLGAAGCRPEGWSAEELRLIRSLSPVPPPPPSPTNGVADLPEAAALGARIFTDPGFSIDGQTSCATCHRPDLAFTDGQRVADLGRGAGTRNVPTVLGAAWGTWFFWDGRADSAWAQATGPLLNPSEHAIDAAAVQARVLAEYRAPMEALFGPLSGPLSGPAGDRPEQSLAQVGKVLEAFERTLPPPSTRFDRYVAALPAGGLFSPEEERGLRLFIGDAQCVSCHNGPLLSDRSFHTLGLPLPPTGQPDPGRARGATDVLRDPFNCRGEWADSPESAGAPGPQGCPELRYLDPSFPDWPAAFKTPGLRGVGQTAPYMHDGSMASLTEVLLFYNRLPGRAEIGHRELTLQPLRFQEADLAALEAFLRTLDADP